MGPEVFGKQRCWKSAGRNDGGQSQKISCKLAVRHGDKAGQFARARLTVASLANMRRVRFISQDWYAGEKKKRPLLCHQVLNLWRRGQWSQGEGFLSHAPPSLSSPPIPSLASFGGKGPAPAVNSSHEEQWWQNRPPQPGSLGHPLHSETHNEDLQRCGMAFTPGTAPETRALQPRKGRGQGWTC